jgi:hypothetical protein
LHINAVFLRFEKVLLTLYDKTERKLATYEDGTAVQSLWEEQKKTLHVWIPHTSIQEVDYQLYDAIGCLYVRDFQSAIPKIEVLLGMCENIPQSYTFSWENIL